MMQWICHSLLVVGIALALGTPGMSQGQDEEVPITDAQTESRVTLSLGRNSDAGCHKDSFYKCCRSCR